MEDSLQHQHDDSLSLKHGYVILCQSFMFVQLDFFGMLEILLTSV